MTYIPSKIDFTPRRHHGYAVLLFIMGTLFPPLAVAARFGIGSDFWINLLLTVMGYIPGHGHNFYIQNIRNNKSHARTPKWAQRYGLVDTSEIRRKERKSQWASRYNDRLPHSALESQAYEEGQEPSIHNAERAASNNPERQNSGLWRSEEESFYNADPVQSSSSSTRWRYPANFQDVDPISPIKGKKKKKEKKDRWARTEDAYSISAEQGRKRKFKKRKSRTSFGNESSRDSTVEFPEEPEGGLYSPKADPTIPQESSKPKTTDEDVFRHEF